MILFQLMDGDIIVYQLVPPPQPPVTLPTARDYFKYLFYKVFLSEKKSYFYLFYFFIIASIYIHNLFHIINAYFPRRKESFKYLLIIFLLLSGGSKFL